MVKVSKPSQNKRFDVPAVGPDTSDNFARRGTKMLVIEADKTVINDRESFIAAARGSGPKAAHLLI